MSWLVLRCNTWQEGFVEVKYICLTDKADNMRILVPLDAHPHFMEIKGKGTTVKCPTEEIDFIAKESLDEVILIMAQYHDVETLNGQAND